MSDQQQRPLSHVRVPIGVVKDLDISYHNLNEHPDLNRHERHFIAVILELANDYHAQGQEPFFDYRQLQGRLAQHNRPLKAESVRIQLWKLAKKGFFENFEMYVDRSIPSRRPLEYRLKEINSAEFQSTNQQELNQRLGGRALERKNPRKVLADLRESDAQLAAYTQDAKHRTDNIWTGLADRVMRFSRREKPTGNRITTEIGMYGVRLALQTTTQTGRSSEIATLRDQRVIRAIISQVAHLIDEKKREWLRDRALRSLDANTRTYDEAGSEINPELTEDDFEDLKRYVENCFYIDVATLARMMGYKRPSSGSARSFVNSCIRRLYETQFRLKILSDDPEAVRTIMNVYDLDDMSADFRFITDLKSQYHADFFTQSNPDTTETMPSTEPLSGDRLEAEIDPYNDDEFERVRVWQISIDSHLYRKLLRDTRSALYTAHAEIMREPDGLAQTLYNWISHIVGRSDPKVTGHNRTCNQALSVIHKTLWPSRYYSRFEDNIVQIIRRHVPDAEFDTSLKHNVARMWGYYWTLYRHPKTEELMLHVVRDENDPLVGDNSFWNTKLRHDQNRRTGAGYTSPETSSLF